MDATLNLTKILTDHAAWLRRAGGTRANLSGATLSRATLYGANLSRANLSRATLYGANLSRANLSGADLYGATLYGADLSRADLSGANLYGATLYGADLSGANLGGGDYSHFSIVPDEGAFVGWKKLTNGIIAQLHIPAEARRVGGLSGRKCRAEWVEVIAFWNKDRTPSTATTGYAMHDGTIYRVGAVVEPDEFDDDIRVECTHGIHFFITRAEAEGYQP